MSKKHPNENYSYKGYFAELKRELSGVKLPATVLTVTLIAAISIPYLGKKISQVSAWYNLQDPLHECIFINFDHVAQREKIEALVAQNIKSFSLVSGAERLGTTLLEEVPGIASIKCSLDTDHTVRLVITGNKTAQKPSAAQENTKDVIAMQVPQHQTTHASRQAIACNDSSALKPSSQHGLPQCYDIQDGEQATPFGDTFELLLSSTDALFKKPQKLPNTFHAEAEAYPTPKARSINIALNDSARQEPELSHKEEPSLSCKRNQL